MKVSTYPGILVRKEPSLVPVYVFYFSLVSRCAAEVAEDVPAKTWSDEKLQEFFVVTSLLVQIAELKGGFLGRDGRGMELDSFDAEGILEYIEQREQYIRETGERAAPVKRCMDDDQLNPKRRKISRQQKPNSKASPKTNELSAAGKAPPRSGSESKMTDEPLQQPQQSTASSTPSSTPAKDLEDHPMDGSSMPSKTTISEADQSDRPTAEGRSSDSKVTEKPSTTSSSSSAPSNPLHTMDAAGRRYIAVAMDETFLDLSPGKCSFSYHASAKKRGPIETEVLKNMKHKTQTGDRLIAVHAVTGDGLLAHPEFQGVVEGTDAEGLPVLREDNKLLTAELVWHSDSKDPDYHKALRGEVFITWLKTRLQPTFQARYGKQARMILFLDSEWFSAVNRKWFQSITAGF